MRSRSRRPLLLVALAALGVLAAGCQPGAGRGAASHPAAAPSSEAAAAGGGVVSVRGSGVPVTEQRTVGGFDSVALDGVGSLAIVQGAADALRVTADGNVLPQLRSDVDGTTLQLGPRPGTSIQAVTPVRYELTVTQLRSIEVDGVAAASADGLTAGDLTLAAAGAAQLGLTHLAASSIHVTVTGSGAVRLGGQAPVQTVRLLGAGSYRAADLVAQRADVTITGSGSCAVRVAQQLDVTIQGSGHVEYVGTPAVTRRVVGSGGVTKIG